ncbi:unnamed protein product [Ceutorhynchus assimilis]|uniref:Uncharacterized protein n=1 Tax=Ceutorhynchus assimilis TaxID=467358 RepID=A0A9N9MGW5_9CUCU|nr:unnamed protein product [Ceutorhynchus assimilis]
MEKGLSIWADGEYVLAQWNRIFYRAIMLDLNISGEMVVLFDSYDIEDEIDHKDMLKYYRKDKNYVKKLGSNNVPDKDAKFEANQTTK